MLPADRMTVPEIAASVYLACWLGRGEAASLHPNCNDCMSGPVNLFGGVPCYG
jgi:hypothetical protein